MKEIKLYGGEITILFDPDKHAYWIQEEKKKRLKGVTTYQNIINKPFLIPWAVNTTVEYVREHLELLRDGTISGDEILKLAREEANKQRDIAGEIGKAIHSWIEKHLKGEKPDMPEDNQILLGVNAFLNWVEDYKVKFLWSEKIVYSRKHGYVGTADLGIKINDQKFLADIKTGNAIYSEIMLQTAAYQMADEEESGEKYKGRIALRISKETEVEYNERMAKKNKIQYPPYQIFESRIFENETLERDFKAFLSCITLCNWQTEAGKEMN